MKVAYKFMLMAGSCFAFLSAELANLSERATMLKDALKVDDMDKVIEVVSNTQQEGKIAGNKSSDDKNYVVIIKKEEDGSYVRVAHFKKDKVGVKITEDVLLKVIEEAEKKLGESKDDAAYEFAIGSTKYFAVISKKDKFLIFNVTSSKEEVNKLLGISEEKKVEAETKKVEAPTTEGKKPDTTTAEVQKVETPAKVEASNG